MEKEFNKRNSIIELIRFLAACEIVCFHVEAPWGAYARVLPIFVIFSVVFSITSHLTFSAQLRKAFKRIVLPWIFWSAIYVLARIARALVLHAPVSSAFEWWMPVVGGAGLLWYLPYVFLSNMGTLYIVRCFGLMRIAQRGYPIAIFSGLLVLTSAAVYPGFSEHFPFAQWLYLFPAVLIGLLFSSYDFKPFKLIFARGVWIVAICSIGALALSLSIGLAYCIAICVVLFAFSYRPPAPNKCFDYLGKLSYGIYLVHILLKWTGLYLGIPPHSYPLLLFTLITSILAVSLLHKTPLRKFI